MTILDALNGLTAVISPFLKLALPALNSIAVPGVGSAVGGVAQPGGTGSANNLVDVRGQISVVLSSLMELVGVVKPFVEAISPSAVKALNDAIRDVQATIGSSLISTVNILAETFRQVGGIILPVVQQLEPVFRALAEVTSNQLLAAVKLISVAFEALAPILQIVADAEKEISKFLLDMVSIIVAVVRTLRDILAGFFGGIDVKEVLKGFVDILRQVVKALVNFAATLAAFAGFGDTVVAFSNALVKEAKDRETAAGGMKAAATNPQIIDVANILRSQQLAAFTAQGGGAVKEKSEVDFLRSIAESAKKTADETKDFKTVLKDWWEENVIGATGGLGGLIRTYVRISNFIEGAANAIIGKFK